MSSSKKLLQAAAGNAGESLYVEDVFSTYLYTGTGSTKTITNGIDLAGEGGLVWIKERAAAGSTNHALMDTERGGRYILSSSTTGAELTASASEAITGFNSNGFNLGTTYSNSYRTNNSGNDYASWTFREAKKFFDVVVYTGDGVSGRTVAHALGSTPAAMFIKRTSASGDDWAVYHSALGATKLIALNTTSASLTNPWLTDTAPTDSVFTLNNYGFINESGSSYVAYLFASDAGGFGDDGDENIIKCGGYTGAGANLEVNVGFEPQFVLIKCTTNAGTNWVMFDTMRGLPVDGNAKDLRPNASDAEGDNSAIGITSTGFLARNGIDGQINASGRSYIYVAIRRPMKTPEVGTEVFAVDKGQDAASGSTPSFISGFPVDLAITNVTIGASSNSAAATRLTGTKYLSTSLTSAESTNATYVFDYMTGWRDSTAAYADIVSWMFKRATGFFDVVVYTGTGSANTISHNLGVIPELIIGKDRDDLGANWGVYCAYATNPNASAALNNTESFGYTTITNGQTPTATTITVTNAINQSANSNVLYLFATLAGVSKVGSYTGTGSNINVDCGFSAGARFVMIKSSGAGDWYVWDSVRGISAGNDPYLLLNSTAAEVTNTDYIDPLNAGFTVTSSAPAGLNANNSTYIFLAIA